MMPKEPTLVPEMVDRVEESLKQITHQVIETGAKRILVTLAEGSDSDGRPLGAVALARALARTDARVVLVDFRGDGADAASMGEGTDLPGVCRSLRRRCLVCAGYLPRPQVAGCISFRPAASRSAAISWTTSGWRRCSPALTLTYDYVLLDSSDEMIRALGPACGAGDGRVGIRRERPAHGQCLRPHRRRVGSGDHAAGRRSAVATFGREGGYGFGRGRLAASSR